jgi:hypothetical protein
VCESLQKLLAGKGTANDRLGIQRRGSLGFMARRLKTPTPAEGRAQSSANGAEGTRQTAALASARNVFSGPPVALPMNREASSRHAASFAVN